MCQKQGKIKMKKIWAAVFYKGKIKKKKDRVIEAHLQAEEPLQQTTSGRLTQMKTYVIKTSHPHQLLYENRYCITAPVSSKGAHAWQKELRLRQLSLT